MPSETYPCYVRISESAGAEEVIELPTEDDGTMLLTTLAAQFPDATGLKFKSESGTWRGLRVTGEALDAPIEGWGFNDYIVTKAAGGKRKLSDDGGPSNKLKKGLLEDLIVLGLPYSSTEEELKEYFGTFGELTYAKIKTFPDTNKSRGFGFIRFTKEEVAEEVLAGTHTLGGRTLEVRFPKRPGQDTNPTKLFIGRLPQGTTTDDLKDCFKDYAPLKDVYIPKNFRGFGFVTFGSAAVAEEALNSTHVIKGSYLNLVHPTPRPDQSQQNMGMQQNGYGVGIQGNMQGNNMQGRMQGGMRGGLQRGMQGGMQGSMQGNNMQGGMQGNNMQGNMQGRMQGNMQLGNMQMQQKGYGNQGNKGGYYTSGYSQKAGKVM